VLSRILCTYTISISTRFTWTIKWQNTQSLVWVIIASLLLWKVDNTLPFQNIKQVYHMMTGQLIHCTNTHTLLKTCWMTLNQVHMAKARVLVLTLTAPLNTYRQSMPTAHEHIRLSLPLLIASVGATDRFYCEINTLHFQWVETCVNITWSK